MSIPFFEEIILKYGVQPDPCKLCTLAEMSPPKSRKEAMIFFRNNELSQQILTGNIRYIHATKKTNSMKSEWTLKKILGNAGQSKGLNQERYTHYVLQ